MLSPNTHNWMAVPAGVALYLVVAQLPVIGQAVVLIAVVGIVSLLGEGGRWWSPTKGLVTRIVDLRLPIWQTLAVVALFALIGQAASALAGTAGRPQVDLAVVIGVMLTIFTVWGAWRERQLERRIRQEHEDEAEERARLEAEEALAEMAAYDAWKDERRGP